MVYFTYPSVFFLSFTLLYWILNVVLHLQFSTSINASYQTPFGPIIPKAHILQLSIITLIGVLTHQVLRGTAGINRKVTLVCWGCCIGSIILINAFLLTTNLEYIHYLQYGGLAYLIALSVDHRRDVWPILEIYWICLILSAIDEANQYFYLAREFGNYLDFNDLVLNQAAVIAGLLLYYGFHANPQSTIKPATAQLRAIVLVLLSVTILIVILWLAGIIIYSPNSMIPTASLVLNDGVPGIYLQRQAGLFASWQPTFTEGRYYVLSPLQGVILILAIYLGASRSRKYFQLA